MGLYHWTRLGPPGERVRLAKKQPNATSCLQQLSIWAGPPVVSCPTRWSLPLWLGLHLLTVVTTQIRLRTADHQERWGEGGGSWEPVLICPKGAERALHLWDQIQEQSFATSQKTEKYGLQNQRNTHENIWERQLARFQKCSFIYLGFVAPKATRVPSIYGTISQPNLLAPHSPEISTKLHSFQADPPLARQCQDVSGGCIH